MNTRTEHKREAADRWCEPTMQPPTDIQEFEDHFAIDVELPGVAADRVDLQVEQGELRVTAERLHAVDENRDYLASERRFGTYCRVFRLGDLVDPEGITAELRDGVLRVQIKKHAKAMPKKIQIN
ncbi:MAG: Hsp20 family protein [Candidatus Eisenbacteria bacterium]|nr:Hsp20 family protein [Candidatus Latescibacterota bacterium]MBD3301448.1 Hsp20 family protein [Candidatus Eisenbacteria bacterium]